MCCATIKNWKERESPEYEKGREYFSGDFAPDVVLMKIEIEICKKIWTNGTWKRKEWQE